MSNEFRQRGDIWYAPYKDPDAVLDYLLDWEAWLDGDTIADSQWLTDDPGLVIQADNFTSTQTMVWLAGGAAGKTYIVTNRITTTMGRNQDQSFRLPVKEN